MALDTKYRPRNYSDVLGQGATVAVLKQFVSGGRGFHQSYVLCGAHGSGKTTLGRILARALLCASPRDGAPCDECSSCTTLLEGGTSEAFEELDAATKSGKSDILRITDQIQYSTFGGTRKVYLFDEAHRLSKAALDAMLKPMEDCVRGSEDKQLVCIFCTTEPDKMRDTIFSRCAPAFTIRAVAAEQIADRLVTVCEAEGITHDRDTLISIAEMCDLHIRDCLKTVEGLHMLGGAVQENLSQYLGLGADDHVLDLLDAFGVDTTRCIEAAAALCAAVSPGSAYERIAEASLVAYKAHLGVGGVPRRWNPDRIAALSGRGNLLLDIAGAFSAPPHRPSRHTLLLDVGRALVAPRTESHPTIKVQATKTVDMGTVDADVQAVPPATVAAVTGSGVYLDPRAVRSSKAAPAKPSAPSDRRSASGPTLPPDTFGSLLRAHLGDVVDGGRAG
jgi:DNA polymerase III subunit gamma/tau